MLRNPFIIYVLSFGAMIGAYKLDWSDITPPLSSELVAFLVGTFVVAICCAVLTFQTTKSIEYHRAVMPNWVIYALALTMSADMVYSGGIPLAKLTQGPFDYALDFGVPHLHVFNVTFGIVFSTIRFADFLGSRRARYLAEALAPIVYFVLIVYRGPAAITLATWAFVHLIMKKPGWRSIGPMAIVGVAGLFLFGVFGDYRVQSEQQIVHLGKPSEAFLNSGVPAPFFWTYTYFTSPLGNLQLSVNTKSLDERSTAQFIASELVPDVLSKHILPLLGQPNRLPTPEIAAGLNVASMYGRPAIYAGWTGMIVVFVAFLLLILADLQLIRRSPFGVPALALLNSFVLFSTFQNMIAYSGVFLQLLWPLLLALVVKRRDTSTELASPRPIH